MTDRALRRLAWMVFGVVLALQLGAAVFSFLNRAAHYPAVPTFDVIGVTTVLFAAVGAPVAARQPRNPIGWIMLGIALPWGLFVFLSGYSLFALVVEPGSLPRAEVALALNSWTWVPAVGLMGTFLLLLFPNGRLPSRRWRAIAWLSGISLVVVSLTSVILPASFSNLGFADVRNPWHIDRLRAFAGVADVAGIALLLFCIGGCSVAVIQRFRRSNGVERLQMKWLAAGAGSAAAAYIALMTSAAYFYFTGSETPRWVEIVGELGIFTFFLIPVSIGFAILKHRLYDIDVIINRAVVFGIIVAFITVVYVGAVAGVGAIVGSREGFGIAPTIVATAIVGLLFQPLRLRARQFADRVVYGKHATPYEALAALARPGSPAELSARVARLAVESTGARRAVVWLRWGRELRPAAAWPDAGAAPSSVPVPADGSRLLPDEHHVQPLVSNDDLLGAISVGVVPGATLSASDERLLADLGAHATVALRHALDTIELPEGQVSFVMTDVEGSTALWEDAPSTMAPALAEHEAIIEAAVAANEGILLRERGEGDSTFSVFTDATAAVAAVLDMQRALARKRWPTPRPIRVRAAIHTGEVSVRDRDYYGPVPNRCARLRAVAHGGQTVLSRPTRDAIQGSLPAGVALLDLGAHRLKDLSSPEHIYQLGHPELPMDFPPLNSLDAIPNNLPPPQRPVTERAHELELIRGLLSRSRLVTLIARDGSEGLDLAVQVAADSLERFPDGAWYVQAENGVAIQASLGGAMRLGSEAENGFLRDKRLLLVLDARHRTGIGPEVAAFMEACPDGAAIVASPTELIIEGEALFALSEMAEER